MESWWTDLVALARTERVFNVVRALVIVVLGFFLARIVSAALGRLLARRTTAQYVMLSRRLTYWVILTLTLVTALRHLGFDLSVLLGAAGILTVAIGFASQTSASNLISGLFLIAERPFVVGDVITVGGRTGEVVSIDLLSIKLRTFDNLLVRLPNESLLKSEIVNVTYYPIRRFDLKVSVAYNEDINKVRRLLLEVADKNPLCFEEPKPLFIFLGYSHSGQDIQFSVWTAKENYLDLANQMYQQVKEAFDRAGVEIPYPQRVLGGASGGAPIAVKIVSGG